MRVKCCARDEQESRAVWKGRKMPLARLGRIAPSNYVLTESYQDQKFPRPLRRIRKSVNDIISRLDIFSCGRWKLHPLFCSIRGDAGQYQRAIEASAEIIRLLCGEIGGALTGELGGHGKKRIDAAAFFG